MPTQRTAGKLGKLPARSDPRTLRIGNYIRHEALPPPPASRSWDDRITSWGMALNDQLGDCVIAAMKHAIQVTSANASREISIDDRDVLAGYEQFCGYVNGNSNTDQGCVELDSLGKWQSQGVGGHKIAAFAACDLHNLDDVKDCINLFGFCYIGFLVPQSAMDQFERGQPWDVVANDGGIVGGHAVVIVDYTTNADNSVMFTVITWGALQKMTSAFFEKYADEAYGVVTPEWIEANGQSPSGLNLQQLLADVQQLQNPPGPTPPSPPPLLLTSTTTVLSGTNPSVPGSVVEITARVAGIGSTAIPTGDVGLSINGSGNATTPVGSDGTALFSVKFMNPTTYVLVATYSGDGTYAGSVSAPFDQIVQTPAPNPPVSDPDVPIEDWLVDVATYLQHMRSLSTDQAWFPQIISALQAWEPVSDPGAAQRNP